MKRYRLIVYWWNGRRHHEYRTACGEYQFEALDDASATKLALAHFEEQIALADQSVVVDELERIVWQNEPMPAASDSLDQT